jgi:hypothetical protein
MSDMGCPSAVCSAAPSSLPQTVRQVHGADLNCSEFEQLAGRWWPGALRLWAGDAIVTT